MPSPDLAGRSFRLRFAARLPVWHERWRGYYVHTTCQLALPLFDSPSNLHPLHGTGALVSFYTAFPPSGSEVAVASQEGMVVVWDVHSRKPMKVFTAGVGYRLAELAVWRGAGTGRMAPLAGGRMRTHGTGRSQDLPYHASSTSYYDRICIERIDLGSRNLMHDAVSTTWFWSV